MAFDWYLRRKYAFLLLALALLVVAHAALREAAFGQWLFDLLATLLCLAAFPPLLERGAQRREALLLALGPRFDVTGVVTRTWDNGIAIAAIALLERAYEKPISFSSCHSCGGPSRTSSLSTCPAAAFP
jgi:hypothetical protein